MEFTWQPACLPAKDKHHVVRGTERRVPQQARRFRGEEIRLTERRELLFERCPAGPHPHIDMLPVIQACTLHRTIVKREAEGLDKVQRGSDSKAGAARVAGVPVNLGIDEHDVHFH